MMILYNCALADDWPVWPVTQRGLHIKTLL